MKVTIITPVYNAKNTIIDTIKSVRLQNYSNYEHIIVDGLSDDGTLDVIQGLPNDARMFWYSEKDRGLYDAINKGLRLSSGEIIGILNADDVFLDENSLSLIVSSFAEGVNFVYSDLYYVRRDDLSIILRAWKSGNFERPMIQLGWMPPHPTVYMLKDFMLKVGDYDSENYKISSDYDYLLRALTRDDLKIHYTNQFVVKMRAGGLSNNGVFNFYKKILEDYRALRRARCGGMLTVLLKKMRKVPQYLGY